MRLSEYEVETIRNVLRKHFGEDSVITLFGSRVDDNARGGDIDLLVEADYPPDTMFRKKLEALSEIQLNIGERKIDLVTTLPVTGDEESLPLIVSEARNTGIRL